MIDCQARGVPGPQIRWKVESVDESISSSSSASAASASIKKMKNRLNPILGSRSEQPDATLFHTVISNPHIQILENGSLMIKEVNWNDNRRYMCTAFNGIGSGISTIIRLSVHCRFDVFDFEIALILSSFDEIKKKNEKNLSKFHQNF